MENAIYEILADTQAITAAVQDIQTTVSNINIHVTYLVVVGAAAVLVYIIVRPILRYFW